MVLAIEALGWGLSAAVFRDLQTAVIIWPSSDESYFGKDGVIVSPIILRTDIQSVLSDECELVSNRPAALPSYAAQRPRHSFSGISQIKSPRSTISNATI